MVCCIPCIVIPLFLWIFHKYIQPFILKFWNPWAKKGLTEQNNVDPGAIDENVVNSEQYKYIQNRIKENPVMIFSKTTCGYCGMVKELFGKIGCDYTLEEIDGKKDCEQLQDIFEKITGSRTVPRVFIGGKCVGGGTDTYTLHNEGKLLPMLKEAGATFKKTD